MYKKWLRDAITRCVKTMAQTAVASLSVSAAITDVNWALVGSSSLLAGLLSLLMSVENIPEKEE